MTRLSLLFTGTCLAALPATAADFGADTETRLAAQSAMLFGIGAPLAASAPEAAAPTRRPDGAAADEVALAEGDRKSVV
jgi:hypothetical protein